MILQISDGKIMEDSTLSACELEAQASEFKAFGCEPEIQQDALIEMSPKRARTRL